MDKSSGESGSEGCIVRCTHLPLLALKMEGGYEPNWKMKEIHFPMILQYEGSLTNTFILVQCNLFVTSDL